MSTQAASYQTDPFLDSSIALETLHLGNAFSSEFISLSLLEQGNQYQGSGMPYMRFLSGQTGSAQAMAPNMQGKGDDDRPRLRNRALRPAPCGSRKESIDAEMNLDNSRVSPAPDMSSNKSSSPLRWKNSHIDKRARHLEQNRAAASKSRQKKKREAGQLQNRFQEVSQRRSSLVSEVKTLRSQLLSLKDQFLMHSRCKDEAIHLYLSRMVNQATTHNSNSSSIGEPEDANARNCRQDSGSVHSHDAIFPFDECPRSHDQDLSGLESPHSRHIPMYMGDTRDLPFGVEEPMMDHEMFSQPPDANIFDIRVGIL